MEGKYNYCNQCFLDRFQKDWSVLQNTSFVETVHPEDVEKCMVATQELLANPSEVAVVEIRKPTNGTYTWSGWEFHLLESSPGIPEGILCLGRDLSEEPRITQEANKFKSQLNAILDSTTDGYLLISADYKILAFNRSAFRSNFKLFGRELQIMEEIWPYVIPEAREPFIKHSQQALNGESVVSDFPYLGHWYQFRYFPATDEMGNIIGFSLNSTDIHEKKALSEYQKTLIKSIPDIFFILDKDGKFKDYKGKREELYIPPQDFIGQHFSQVLPPHICEQLGTALHKAKLEGSIAEISYSMEFHQETKFFEARVSLLGEEDFLMMARDVSRRKKAELKLAE